MVFHSVALLLLLLLCVCCVHPTQSRLELSPAVRERKMGAKEDGVRGGVFYLRTHTHREEEENEKRNNFVCTPCGGKGKGEGGGGRFDGDLRPFDRRA